MASLTPIDSRDLLERAGALAKESRIEAAIRLTTSALASLRVELGENDLMQGFYAAWLDGGNARVALRASQAELRHKYRLPLLWGGFVVVGHAT